MLQRIYKKKPEPAKQRSQKQNQKKGTEKCGSIKKKRLGKGKGKQKVKKMRVNQDDFTSGESDVISLHDINSSIGEEDFSTLFDDEVQEELDLEIPDEHRLVYSDLQEVEEDHSKTQSKASTGIKENDFVVVVLTYDEGKKNEAKKEFIGKIVEKNNATFKISYMRNYKDSQEVFVFPNVEDVEEEVELHRIKRVVEAFSEVRGRYTFYL